MTLLIHSMSEFSSLIFPILDFVRPKKMCEIGTEHGGLTTILDEWSQKNDSHLFGIDPSPSQTFRDWLPIAHCYTHIDGLSISEIPNLQGIDCWFIDGDHNWYTVFNELSLIRENSKKFNRNFLVFIHDVGWPWARRDLYYSPSSIPKDFLHDHNYDYGVTLENKPILNGGFRGNGQYAIANHDGGEKNGVLTAIEDFAKPFGDEYFFANIPAVFGLGIIYNEDAPWAADLTGYLLPFHQNQLIAKLEENRLRNYLKVIEMQDKKE
jgi:hypothetical protein